MLGLFSDKKLHIIILKLIGISIMFEVFFDRPYVDQGDI
jgi:hypothetical protein